ncbi:tudor domain-containing protein 6 [Lagopus muta]|uniref:tudor domain-containing protein 6 n=1 Tax=Lagopus muta TaxID=64668 RepID=UPI00209D9460|nr:tudor domain-containing protein 6 [Lagopus muta]
MGSVPELPGPGAAVSLQVRAVDVRPTAPVVRLWGALGERRAERVRPCADIRAAAGSERGAGRLAGGAELRAGELGLVELAGLWHRCRVLSLRGRGRRVFLLDEGRAVTVSAEYLARGGPELFGPPPEALGCVVADLVPPESPAAGACGDASSSAWTEEAMELLRCLHGKELPGIVRELLVPQRLLVLELPLLVAQMRRLGLAGHASPGAFGQLLRRCLPREAESGASPAHLCDGEGEPAAPCGRSYVEMRPGPSYGGQLEVGCTVDVVVTCAESPGYFWCQLKKCGEFTALMAEIQEYCESASQPHAWPQSACLARYSEDKRWYRALIVSDVSPAGEVEVMYVDYGNRELVSLTSLRSINERFLKLKAQAFRCSLYNLIHPNGPDPFVWDEAAILAFQEFVDASSNQFELQCTIFALASRNNRELFNIVDLMTPFQSASQFLTDRGVAKRLPPQTPLAASVRLHSFYYSMHEIKIGSEEDVFITHVDDPQTFYCQLERCANVLLQLSENVSRLRGMTSGLETWQRFGELCLARYTDSHWYRGVLTKTKPAKEVFFVDFGNTETIEEDQLFPIPGDAHDILLLPMQAIKCSLADVPNVPQEATAWFKQAVLERQLKAIVVAKESGGKLLIELFDGNMQINAKLKEEFRLRNNAEVCRCVRSTALYSSMGMEKRNGDAHFPPNAGESKNCRPEAQGGERSSKMQVKEKDVNLLQPAAKRERAAGLLASEGKVSSKKDALLNKVEEMQSLLSAEMDAESDNKRDTEGSCVLLKRVTDLPQQSVVPALTALAYVSYVNNPLDFYVQLASDEAQLHSISECLKDEMLAKIPCGQLLQAGDLICALYSDDSLWYRAVVKEKASDHLISVRYIDYGNTSVVDVDQVRRLPEDLESIPAIGIHCFLGGLKCKMSTGWAEKAAPCFTKRVNEALLTCEFVEEVDGKWGVILSDDQGEITVDLVDERSYSNGMLDRSDVINTCEPSSPGAQNEASCDCTSLTWKFPEAGQTVHVYITVVNGPDYFWSCSADEKNMTYVEEKIKEAENLGLNSMDSCIKSGDICLAKYSEDGKFYRAKVSSVKGNDVAVIHVDYGSEETVSLEMLKAIPGELLQVPNQAFACCLSGFSPSEGSWLSEAKDKFYDMTVELLLEAEVLGTQENKAFEVPLCAVKLESPGRNINEEMKSFWKADMGSGHKDIPDPEGSLEGNRSSNSDAGLCLKRETATCGLAQEVRESALLCSQCSSGEPCGCSGGSEAKVSAESREVAGGCETAEHGSSFDKETAPLEDESSSKVLLEPRGSCSLHGLGGGMKSALQEPPELLFLQDAEVKAEVEAASPLPGNEEELMRWLQVEPSMGDTTEALIELVELQMHSSYDDLKELILELEEIAALPSVTDEMREALETEALGMQTASGSEAREKVLEVREPLLLCEEMGHSALLQSGTVPSLSEGESSMPSVSDAGKTAELFPSDFLPLRQTAEVLELNCSGVHGAEAVQEDWMEVEPPLMLPSSDGRPEKQPKAPGAEIDQLLDLHKNDDCYVKEWTQQDMEELFKECGSTPTHMQSSDCKPSEEAGKKQSDNMADYSAGCSGYTCKLKGFAVGSKCVVWTSQQWCEALILEVSEKGTRVLNLCSGSEEVVDPENVWNVIPSWAGTSPERTTHVTEDVLSLPEESLLQEEQSGCSSARSEDPHVLQPF